MSWDLNTSDSIKLKPKDERGETFLSKNRTGTDMFTTFQDNERHFSKRA
jgi:hypothetical protein